MDMTRDFINRLLELDVPHTVDYCGRTYTDKKMTLIPQEVTAHSLVTHTLSSIVDYIMSGADKDHLPASKFIIHIAGHDRVELYKELNCDKERDELISAACDGSDFPFGHFLPLENFIINLQSLFVQDENTNELLKFVGSVKNDSSAEQHDNGVSQQVSMKQGISLTMTAKVPNPVLLCPFRTFSEVDQPQSAFVFRLRNDSSQGVMAALFEADGAAWKREAIGTIQTYFSDYLNDQSVIILA